MELLYTGDLVCKKSRKPFQNKKRIGKIIGHTIRFIPDKGLYVPAVYLKGCAESVTNMTIHSDRDELELLAKRDIENPLGGKDND